MASAVVPHPSGASLTIRSSQRSIGSATAPVHIVADATTDEPYMEVQCSYDPDDEHLRQNIVKFPNAPHWKESTKFHASDVHLLQLPGDLLVRHAIGPAGGSP